MKYNEAKAQHSFNISDFRHADAENNILNLTQIKKIKNLFSVQNYNISRFHKE